MNINRPHFQEINRVATHEASHALSKLIGLPITIGTVHFEVREVSKLFSFIDPHDLVLLIDVPLLGDFCGTTMLLMPQQTALGLSDLMVKKNEGGGTQNLSPVDQEALKEMGNIVIGNYLKILAVYLENKTILHGPSRLLQGEFQTTVLPALFSLAPYEDKGIIIEVVFGFQDTTSTGYVILVFGGDSTSERQRTIEEPPIKTYLENVLDSVFDPILVVNYDGIIQIANPATIKMLGYDKEADLVGKLLTFILKKEEQFLSGASLEKMAAAGSIPLLEGKFYGRNFQPIPVLISEAEMRDEDEKLIGFVIVAKDITELKKVEKMKDEFITTVSHELRTPLCIIKSALENLKDGILGPLLSKQLYMVETSARNCSRLSRLIDNLLDLSRLETCDSKISPSRISLPSLIHEIVDGFQVLVNGNGDSVPTELVEEMPADLPEVIADREMMARVLTNLLQNAIHFASLRVVVRVCPKAVMMSNDTVSRGFWQRQKRSEWGRGLKNTLYDGPGG